MPEESAVKSDKGAAGDSAARPAPPLIIFWLALCILASALIFLADYVPRFIHKYYENSNQLYFFAALTLAAFALFCPACLSSLARATAAPVDRFAASGWNFLLVAVVSVPFWQIASILAAVGMEEALKAAVVSAAFVFFAIAMYLKRPPLYYFAAALLCLLPLLVQFLLAITFGITVPLIGSFSPFGSLTCAFGAASGAGGELWIISPALSVFLALLLHMEFGKKAADTAEAGRNDVRQKRAKMKE